MRFGEEIRGREDKMTRAREERTTHARFDLFSSASSSALFFGGFLGAVDSTVRL